MTEQHIALGERVAVIGLGPVGLILAMHLKEAGCTVAVCDNDKVKVNMIRKEGIKLEGAIQKQAFIDTIYTDFHDIREFNPAIIFVCIKGYSTPAFVEQVMSMNLDSQLFVSAQNGIDVEQIFASGISESKTLRMVINFAGNLISPNVVKVTFFNPPNYIASLDDSKIETARQISSWFNSINLTTQALTSFEMLKQIWEKTILNSSLSALCGIGKLTIKEAMNMPDTVEIIEQVIEEAVEVAEAEKIKFEDEFIRKCLRYLKKAGDHFPSLAVDLINNRPTEIDFMNGKIVEYGRKHYIRTPINLAFTNMVKAMTIRSSSSFMKTLDPSIIGKKFIGAKKSKMENGVIIKGDKSGNGEYFLGVDLGSSYTKFIVIDSNSKIAFKLALKTINRDKIGVRHVLNAIRSEFEIKACCATGYGRKSFPDADFVKTEINCAAEGVSLYAKGEKNIIDIGGEDIKVIHCDSGNHVENFYLNDKCAAGTGSFITEISERAEINIGEMSLLAARSNNKTELNSFCTVFAKTEIMKWLIEGMSVEDISKGVYLSIANRVAKLRIKPGAPVYLIGGVVAFHPYLIDILEKKLSEKVETVEHSQFMTALGAAVYAKQNVAVLENENITEHKIL
ncbi:MAG: 2-dehydropantoate 2-reductase [Bacteroidetes bacterium]|nr:2-dehydropantoate 2-reductase [Bacteroidota bacterium]